MAFDFIREPQSVQVTVNGVKTGVTHRFEQQRVFVDFAERQRIEAGQAFEVEII
jgi:hypothetical protein